MIYSIEYRGAIKDYMNDEERSVYVIYKDNIPIYLDEEEYMYLMFEISESNKSIVFTKRPVLFDEHNISGNRSYYDNRIYEEILKNKELYDYLKETLPLLIGFKIVNL